MSAPRFVRPGRTWMITRRTTRRHYLLKPDSTGISQNIYWYVTAVFARKFGIKLHAVQVLSTHIHEIVTDVHGNLPAFVRERNRALANAVKCQLGWPEEVFQRAPASYVELCSAKAIAEKIGYTIANCVEAGLVESPTLWPGVTTAASEIGARIVRAKRPHFYFDPQNPIWPERASIRIEMPLQVVREYGTRAAAVLASVTDSAVSAARRAMIEGQRVAQGVAKVLSVSPRRRARSREMFGGRNPTFASGGDRNVFNEARAERRGFYDAYRTARGGLRGSIPNCGGFPVGSWRWVVELLAAPADAHLPKNQRRQAPSPQIHSPFRCAKDPTVSQV